MLPGSAPMAATRSAWMVPPRRRAWVAGRAVAVLATVGMAAVALGPWFLTRSAHEEAHTGLLLLGAAVILVVVDGRAAPARPASAWVTGLIAIFSLALTGAGALTTVRLALAMGLWGLAVASRSAHGRLASSSILPVTSLGWLGLPLSGDIDVVGFPLRLFAADVASAVMGILTPGAVVSRETVLITEGALADVEAPCAGLATLRLLWAVVCVLAGLWRAPPGRFAVVALVAGGAAVVGNAARVAVLCGLVLEHQDRLAHALHVPLGVCVFLAAVAVASWWLQRPAAVVTAPPSQLGPLRWGTLVALVLGAALALLTTLPVSTTPASVKTTPPIAPTFPTVPTLLTATVAAHLDAGVGAQTTTVALTPAEAALFSRHAWFAEKRALPSVVGGGQALFVVSSSLRALHSPERCLAGMGHRIDSSEAIDVGGGGDRISVRRLILDGGTHTGLGVLLARADDGELVQATSLGEVARLRVMRRTGPWVFVSAVVPTAQIEPAAHPFPPRPAAEVSVLPALFATAVALLSEAS